MPNELANSAKVVGVKQVRRALSAGRAKRLYLALDADPQLTRPLSDRKLCEALAAEGCPVSRRTVAKYRDELNIPGASGRKERN